MNLSIGNSTKNFPSVIGSKDGWNPGANGIRWNGTHKRNGFAVFLNPGDPLMAGEKTFVPDDNVFIDYVLQRNNGVWMQYYNGEKDLMTISNFQEYDLCHNSGMSIGWSSWDSDNGFHIGKVKKIKINNIVKYK